MVVVGVSIHHPIIKNQMAGLREVISRALFKDCPGCKFLACSISRVPIRLSIETYRGARGFHGMCHMGIR